MWVAVHLYLFVVYSLSGHASVPSPVAAAMHCVVYNMCTVFICSYILIVVSTGTWYAVYESAYMNSLPLVTRGFEMLKRSAFGLPRW